MSRFDAARRTDFLEPTGLEVTDTEDYRVTLPYSYPRLLEHICVHDYYLGLGHGRGFDWQEAVGSWRDTSFDRSSRPSVVMS